MIINRLVWIALVSLCVCFILVLLVMRAWRNSHPHQPRRNIFDIPVFATGDLILANVTRFVPSFTRARFHHTGIIYVHPHTQQVFVWHVTRFPADLSSVNFHPLHMFCRLVKGQQIGFRRLMGPTNQVVFPDLAWCDHWQKHAVLDFDIVGRVFSNAVEHIPPGNLGDCCPEYSHRNSSSVRMACVDLTTLTYVKMGILHKQALKRRLLVEHYCESLSGQQRLPFVNGFSLGPEIVLTTTTTTK